MKQRSSTQTNPRPSKPGLHHQSLRCSALFLSFIAFTLLQYPQLARAQDADPANQSYIFNHHSPAFDASSPHFFDASAAATRPGQLPFVNESNAKYTFVTNNEAFAHGLYAATPLFANLKLGLAVDFVSATEDAPYFRQYRAGLGWRIADSLGLAAQYSSFASESSRQVDELSHWSLGFGFQPIPALFISAAAHRFDTPRYGDEWLDPLYRAQLSYALFDGQLRLDLGAQSDSENWPDGYYNSSLFSQISSWLELYAIAQSDLETARWGGGARLSMGSLSLESALFAASNSAHVNFDSLTVGLSWHPEAPETELFNDHRWLDISIPGSLPERPISSFFSPNSPAFLAFLNKIETLTQSQEYTGLLLRLDAIAYNYSQIYELRQSLKRLQAQGLTLVIHSDSTSSRALYLGAVADRLYFTPTTPVSANGILLRKTYYRGLLDHIGVLPEFVKIDEYKSAPDSYLRKTPTDTDREQTDDYLDALYSELVNGISSGRQIEPEIVRYALDNAPIMPNDALELGLFDGEVYSDQMHDRIRQELDPDAQFQTHHQDALANPWQDRPKIVVIVVDSAIVTGPSIDSPFSNSQVTGSKTIGEMLNQAAKDSEVAAIVLRIDSPGGSAHASELIHHAAQEAARSKPLVVSMGSVAASGGYYIATPADAIFATPPHPHWLHRHLCRQGLARRPL